MITPPSAGEVEVKELCQRIVEEKRPQEFAELVCQLAKMLEERGVELRLHLVA